jgi:DNA-directed RNA polymerase specialized sigma24 family protein
MRTAKSRVIIRHISREEGQPDPLLVPLLQAADEAEAADWLVILIEQHARPVIERVAGRGREAEDLRSEIIIRVVELLQNCRANQSGKPISDFGHYVSVVAANVCRDELRRESPRRRSLKDSIRHLLNRQSQFALWYGADQSQLCGLADWRDQTPGLPQDSGFRQMLDDPQSFSARVLARRDAQRLDHTELLTAIFNDFGHPLRFDDLINLVAELQGVRDYAPETDHVDDDAQAGRLAALPDTGPRSDEEVQWRQFLASVWREVEQLPPLQRISYLLNFTDADGEIALFWWHGVASIERIGATLEIADEQFDRLWPLLPLSGEQRRRAATLRSYGEKFSLLWQRLPIEDATIAAMLGTTRQNVINLRQAARRRLGRRLGNAQEK